LEIRASEETIQVSRRKAGGGRKLFGRYGNNFKIKTFPTFFTSEPELTLKTVNVQKTKESPSEIETQAAPGGDENDMEGKDW